MLKSPFPTANFSRNGGFSSVQDIWVIHLGKRRQFTNPNFQAILRKVSLTGSLVPKLLPRLHSKPDLAIGRTSSFLPPNLLHCRLAFSMFLDWPVVNHLMLIPLMALESGDSESHLACFLKLIFEKLERTNNSSLKSQHVSTVFLLLEFVFHQLKHIMKTASHLGNFGSRCRWCACIHFWLLQVPRSVSPGPYVFGNGEFAPAKSGKV